MKTIAPSYSKLNGSSAFDLRKSVENINKCFIGASSWMTYNHKLVMLMVWLFDCWQKHLEKSTVMRMKNMEKLNKEQAKATKEKKKGEGEGEEYSKRRREEKRWL